MLGRSPDRRMTPDRARTRAGHLPAAALCLCLVTLGLGEAAPAATKGDKPDSVASQTMPSTIVGGSIAPAGAYPFFVSIQTPSGSAFCGGTLVSSMWVLTAAQCVDGGMTTASLKLVIGANQLDNEAAGNVRSCRGDPHPPVLEPLDA